MVSPTLMVVDAAGGAACGSVFVLSIPPPREPAADGYGFLSSLGYMLSALAPPPAGARLFSSASACQQHRQTALRQATGSAADWLREAQPRRVPLAAALASTQCQWAVAPPDAAAALRLLRRAMQRKGAEGGQAAASAAALAAGDTPVFHPPGVVLELPDAAPLRPWFLSAQAARRSAAHALSASAWRAVEERALERRATAAALLAAARRAMGTGAPAAGDEEDEEEEGESTLTRHYLREMGGLSGGSEEEAGMPSTEGPVPADARLAPLLALSALGCGIAGTVAGVAEALAACTPPGRRLLATGSLAEPPCLQLRCAALRPLLAHPEPDRLLVGDLGSLCLPAELEG